MKGTLMKRRNYLQFLLVVITISGCGNIVNYVDPSPIVNTEMGYIYGLFSVEEQKAIKIGLVLQNTNTKKEYMLMFKEVRNIYAIAVPRGTYKLTKIIYSNEFGALQSEQDISMLKGVAGEFTVLKARAYYIGDFYGDTHNFNAATYTTTYWRVKDIRYNYEGTTKLFLKQNPQFSGINTVPAFDFS
jgi:hypothetical protein